MFSVSFLIRSSYFRVSCKQESRVENLSSAELDSDGSVGGADG